MNWADVVPQVVTTPNKYRSWISMEHARELLRCDYADIEQLIDAGAPTISGLFDWYDIRNFGLYSGSARSRPELELAVFRRCLSSDADWTLPIRFSIAAEATCPLMDRCESNEWMYPSISSAQWFEYNTRSGWARWRGRIESRGARKKVLDKNIVEMFTAARHQYRFHYLPSKLGSQADMTRSRRVGDCSALSKVLADDLLMQSIQAKECYGLVLGGIQATRHKWVEVIDSDGEKKSLDLWMAILAGNFLQDELLQFSLGSRMSRLVALEGVNGATAKHLCNGEVISIEPDFLVKPLT